MFAEQVCNVQGMCHQDGPAIEEKGEIQPTSGTMQPCKQMDEDPGDGLDASSDGYDDDNSCRDEDDYYAFLREMAGSFEATYDEDESDEGSEVEAEVEEEQPSNRKRSSSFWLDQRPASLTSASGFTTRDMKMNGSKDAFRGPIQAVSKELDKMGEGKAGSQPKNSPGTPWSGSGSTGSTFAASPSDSNLSELSDSEDDRSSDSDLDDSRPLVPTPSHDHRPPVVDSYDVVQAVKHFASQRTADPKELQKEDMLTAIKMKQSQMKQLRSSSKNLHFKQEVRAHYAKICKEIETEVVALEASLSTLK